MKLTIKDQTCHLLPERALFWEEERALILSDIHLGKAAVFRKSGIPIPEGDMQADLDCISALLQERGVKKCIIVGDLIHAEVGLTAEVIDTFSHWLHKSACEIHLVLGNHDISLKKGVPDQWPLHMHMQSLLLGPFYFSHFPVQHKEAFVWSGHLHPQVALKSSSDKVVLRCFQISSELGILPAFGSFVGGLTVKRDPSSHIFGIAGSTVIKIPF